jgi:hypothetical protein
MRSQFDSGVVALPAETVKIGETKRSITVTKLYLNELSRVTSSRSRFPEIVGNIKNAEQRMEGLEEANALAKQVTWLRQHRRIGVAKYV